MASTANQTSITPYEKTRILLGVVSAFALAATAHAQFDTALAWGDADPTGSNGNHGGPADTGTDPINGQASGTFTSDGTTTTITSGGFDFWSPNDGATVVHDSSGAYTTTGDFSASVRHVEVNNNIANQWGRDVIDARAVSATFPDGVTPNTAGVPTYNDAHVMAVRQSNGLFATGWRDVIGANTGRNDTAFPRPFLGPVGPTGKGVPLYMAIGRDGNNINTAFAMDIGGVAGRYVQHGTRAPAAMNGGNAVTVVLGHQAHNEGANHPVSTVGGGGGGRINTATFDNFNYATSYDAALFGPAAGEGADPWTLGGNISADPTTGQVSGAAYVTQSGAATGEAVKWTATATPFSPYMPGVAADIYFGGNPGNEAAVRAAFAANAPAGSTVLPNIDWTGNNGTSATNADQYNQGQPGDFLAAVPGFNPNNQDNYGVRMRGEIWIPGDADRLPGDDANIDTVAFKDGIDDYTFLNIDGGTIVDDNTWTSYAGNANGGSPIVQLDVSDPKYDDGEWVSFEMIMWEGGGGDAGVLYWDQNAAGGFPTANNVGATTDAVVPSANYRHRSAGPTRMKMGFAQVGSDTASGDFPLTLTPGDWELGLTVENTGAVASFSGLATVNPGPPQIAVYCGPDGPGETYWEDFCYIDGTNDLADGSTIGSNNFDASVQGGSLALTDSLVVGTSSSFRIPALDNSSLGWQATIDFSLLHEAGHPNPEPADGFSFNYGAIPARTGPGSGPDQDGSAEEGWGGGIQHMSFELDTWMNGDIEQGYNIGENGVDLAGGFQNGSILPADGSVSGTIEVSWDPATATFTTSDVGFDANLMGLPHGFTGDDAYGFGISARTGGATQTLRIDSIQIETFSDPAVEGGDLIDFGSTNPGVPICKDFTIANPGQTDLNFTAAAVLPQYWSITGTAPTSVPAGGKVTIELCFDGGGPGGIVGGTVSIPTDDPATPTFSFDVQAEVIDTTPPVINGVKDLVFTVGEEFLPLVVNYNLTATDNLDPAPSLDCTPPTGSSFGLGTTTVDCVSMDAAGNVTNESFTVSVLALIPAESELDVAPRTVVLGGWDAPSGPAGSVPAGTTLRAVRQAYLNENGSVAVRTSLLGGGASTEAVISNSLASGDLELVGATGLNDVTSLDRLQLNDAGDVNFRGDTAADFTQRATDTAGASDAIASPRASTQAVYQQAQAGANSAAPAVFKRVGSVTALNDTLIILPDGTSINEGAAVASIPGATYGQISPRVVANPSGDTIAFTSSLRGVPGATAVALFVGGSDGTGLAPVLRKGDSIPGSGGTLSSIASESINEGGDLAVRATIRGAGIGGANNDVLITNRGGAWELVAREGATAPCISPAGPTFQRFDKVFVAEDGNVIFSAFLAGTGVNSSNDGSLWRSDPSGGIHLIVREGDVANTESVYAQLLGCSAATDGKTVYEARLVTGIGETITTNRSGLWAQRTAGGPAELLLRQGDTFVPEEEEDSLSILSIDIDGSTNPQGGSGGYGRVISEGGQVVVRLSLSGGTASSGAFLIDLEDLDLEVVE